ncbi:MAG TPA: M15 family metallopeptidase [Actinomycetota bacterium]|nr:M15 family metallopeptidase [Actinomycetota bacterium]
MTYAGPRYVKAQWRAAVTNGQIPRERLAVVEAWPTFDRDLGGPALMHPEAAAAMGVMLRTAALEGFGDLTISLSYRTLEKQLEKWENFQAGGNLAAFPGTSNHGWAVAGDMRWGRAVSLAWLQANAARFGFVNDVPSENWHYTFQEGLWKGEDMTEDEKQALNQWTRFLKKLRAELGGGDDPESLASRAADAIKKRHDTHAPPGEPGPHEHSLVGKAQ